MSAFCWWFFVPACPLVVHRRLLGLLGPASLLACVLTFCVHGQLKPPSVQVCPVSTSWFLFIHRPYGVDAAVRMSPSTTYLSRCRTHGLLTPPYGRVSTSSPSLFIRHPYVVEAAIRTASARSDLDLLHTSRGAEADVRTALTCSEPRFTPSPRGAEADVRTVPTSSDLCSAYHRYGAVAVVRTNPTTSDLVIPPSKSGASL